MIRPFIYGGELIYPTIGANPFVDESAQVIGDVRIGNNVSILCCAVLRADEAWPFIIGDNVNIQDGVVFHGLAGLRRKVGQNEVSIYVGENVSIAHGAVVHGPSEIGRGSFVGFKSVIHNAVIGQNVYIGHMVLVSNVIVGDFLYIPDGSIITKPEDLKNFEVISDQRIRNFGPHVVQENNLLRQKHLALDNLSKSRKTF